MNKEQCYVLKVLFLSLTFHFEKVKKKNPHSCDSGSPAVKRTLIKPPLKSIHPFRCGKEANTQFKLRTPLNNAMDFIKGCSDIFTLKKKTFINQEKGIRLSLWVRGALLQGSSKVAAARGK